MKEFEIASCGGGALHCYAWEPEGEPRGVVQLVHGIAEHMGRYDEFARCLTGHGFLVVAEDHMGHGKTVKAGEQYGCFTGGWHNAVADTHSLFAKTAAEHPDIPYFLFGHSMGSFMTRTFLIDYPDARLAGAILSGTGQQPGAVVRGGLLLCGREEKKYGENGYSETIKKLIFGAYNKHFQPERTPNDWICSDEAVVDAYGADPLCGFDATVGLARDMLQGIVYNQSRANLEKMDKALPVLFLSGAQDPVGNMGKGVRQAYASFEKAGMKNLSIKLYENGRHEMLNEKNKAEVYRFILDWLRPKL